MKLRTSWIWVILFLAACAQPSSTLEVIPTETLSVVTASEEQPMEVVLPTVTAQPSPTLDTNQPPYFYVSGSAPSSESEDFGPDFFSGSFHSAPVFAPDMKTMWWAGSYGSATIYTSHYENGVWSNPEIIEFSDSIKQYRDPFISPDGELFFFISPDPIPDISSGKENIWMMAKEGESWGEPQPLPQSINALDLHWTISVAANYDLYFSAGEPGNKNIYMSPYIDGGYTDPILLPPEINSDVMDITPNIAPDGSYLLFSRYFNQEEMPYLYISYATELGWTEAVKIENIPYCISPIVTPDGQTVIYLSSPTSFGWRDTSFIKSNHP